METYHAIPDENFTYDVQFHNENYSNSKGFEMTFQQALDYINNADRTTSYWPDYRGGVVQIVCNQTGQTTYTQFL